MAYNKLINLNTIEKEIFGVSYSKFSIQGLVSISIPIFIVLINILFITISSNIYPTDSALPEGSVGIKMFILIVFGGMTLSLTGCVFAIIGLNKTQSKKIVSLIGLFTNGIIFLLLFTYAF